MTTLYAIHPSRLGALLLVGERAADGSPVLTGCYLPGHRRGPAVQPSWREEPAAFAAAIAALDAHLGSGPGRRGGEPGDPGRPGGEPGGAPLRLELRGGTPFQRRTWEALREIPWGATVTYGELAARLGRPGAARAVGAAVARNPIAILVPCHRVVGARGAVTGYAGGVERKAALLEIEDAALSGPAGAGG